MCIDWKVVLHVILLLLQVFLHANGTGTKYDTVEVDVGSPINADLLLDSTKQNVYVLTERKVRETNNFLSTASNWNKRHLLRSRSQKRDYTFTLTNIIWMTDFFSRWKSGFVFCIVE